MTKILFMTSMVFTLFLTSLAFSYNLPQGWTEVARTTPNEFVLTTRDVSVSQDSQNWFNIIPFNMQTDLATLAIDQTTIPTSGIPLSSGAYPYTRIINSGQFKVKANVNGYITTGNMIDIPGYGPIMEAQIGATPIETIWGGTMDFTNISSDLEDPLIVTGTNTIICTIKVSIENIIILGSGPSDPFNPGSPIIYAFFVDTGMTWFGHDITESD